MHFIYPVYLTSSVILLPKAMTSYSKYVYNVNRRRLIYDFILNSIDNQRVSLLEPLISPNALKQAYQSDSATKM